MFGSPEKFADNHAEDGSYKTGVYRAFDVTPV